MTGWELVEGLSWLAFLSTGVIVLLVLWGKSR